MKIIPANNLVQIKQLLDSADLPTDDINEQSSANFFILEQQSEAIGLIGMECVGNDALLRSLMVKPGYRNQGFAAQLIRHVEQIAELQAVSCLYLLTTAASPYFLQQGFQIISREATPETIKATDEFSHICPASATIMYKILNT
ncbi:MAG: arsenic resistance N-acetyltransferase ArsN2 [Sedimenticola sp.]|nr:arsenic resistance N-acetyltransferase ArsN2 [Sedimenticola sp.]